MNASDAFYPPWYWMVFPFFVLFIVLWFTNRCKNNAEE